MTSSPALRGGAHPHLVWVANVIHQLLHDFRRHTTEHPGKGGQQFIRICVIQNKNHSAAPRHPRAHKDAGTWLLARTHLMAFLAFAYIIPVLKSRPRAQLLLPAWFMRSPKGNM